MDHWRPIWRSLAGLVAALCFLAGCAACSRADASLERQLDAAEALLWSGDSAEVALARLTAIDTAAVADGEQRARLALLTAFARHKSYIDDTTLTVLAPALARYDGPSPRGSRRNRALALFLKGRISYNREAYADAIIDLMKADDLLEGTDHHLLRGFIRQSIAESYQGVYSFKEQLNYNELAYESFKASGNSDYTAYALVDVAKGYQYTYNYDRAVLLARQASNYADSVGDNRLKATSNIISARSFQSLNMPDSALVYYMKVFYSDSSFIDSNDAYILIDNIHLAEGKLPDRLSNYLHSINSGLAAAGSPSILASEGRYKEAYDAKSQESEEAWARLGTLSNKNLTGTILKLRESEKAAMKSEVRNSRLFFSFITIIFALIFTIVFISLKNRISQAKLREQFLLERAKALESEITIASDNISLLNKQLSSSTDLSESIIKRAEEDLKRTISSYSELFFIVDSLFGKWYDVYMKSTDSKEKNKIRKWVNKIFKDDIYCDISRILEIKYADYNIELSKIKDIIGEREYNMFLMMTVNLTSKSIALILEIPIDTVYRRRYLIRDKIGECSEYDYLMPILNCKS